MLWAGFPPAGFVMVCSPIFCFKDAATKDVGLRYLQRSVFQTRLYRGEALLFDPYLAEIEDACRWTFFVEDGDEVVPRGVGERELVQIFLQTAAKRLGAHLLFQFAHHHGSLVVDDVSMKADRHSGDCRGLLDGVGAIGAVGAEGTHLITFQEVEVVVDVGKLLSGNLCSHEIGKHLLGPHVVEPAHGDHVAKPQMHVVSWAISSNRFSSSSGVGFFPQENALVAKLYRPGCSMPPN